MVLERERETERQTERERCQPELTSNVIRGLCFPFVKSDALDAILKGDRPHVDCKGVKACYTSGQI